MAHAYWLDQEVAELAQRLDVVDLPRGGQDLLVVQPTQHGQSFELGDVVDLVGIHPRNELLEAVLQVLHSNQLGALLQKQQVHLVGQLDDLGLARTTDLGQHSITSSS